MSTANSVSDFLNMLTMGNRPNVTISVTPGVGLEMIVVDIANYSVKNYTYRPLAYNESLREISDIEEFKRDLSEMFEELNISPKCNVTLNLPTVLFGSIELSLMLGDEAITSAITSEVEQSYVFKRHDPIVKWMDSSSGNTENRRLFYAAVQQLVIENISNALIELGANLVDVEMSLASTLRALDYTGLANAQMQEGVTWNLLTINSNGYNIISMSGKKIVDYYEEPIAVKSYDGDEIYNVIASSAQITLMSYPANYLFIISDTDSVSAELLAKKINVGYSIEYIENNKFKAKEILPASLDVLQDNVLKISIQAVGAAVAASSDYPLAFNFLASSDGEAVVVEDVVKIPIGDNEYAVTPSVAAILAGVVGAVLLIPVGIAFLLLPQLQAQKQAELDELNANIQQVEKQIADLKEQQQIAGKFNIKSEINKVLQNNRIKLMSYSAIGEAVPPELWLTYFKAEGGGDISIQGGSNTVEDVYLFFKNVKEYLVKSDLKLQKLEMQSDNVDEFMSNLPVTYDFEISNIKAPVAAATGDDKSKDGKDNSKDSKNSKDKKGKTTGQAANVVPDKKLLSDKPIN